MTHWLGQRGRLVALVVWAAVAATVLGLYLVFQRHLNTQMVSAWFADNLLLASILYTLMLSVRGVFLVPSTPLLFVGITVFPGPLVWTMNMVGILTSSALVYTLVRGFGFDYMLREKYQARTRQLSGLMRKHGVLVIIGWSFFPVVPTDVIIYTAATLRMSLTRCLIAVGVGEGVLITFYVAGGATLMAFLTG